MHHLCFLLAAARRSTMRAMFGTRLDLSGARAIVTGASSGIGHALALRLAEQRVRLVLASRNRERLDELAKTIQQRGGEAHVVPTDVADAAQRVHLMNAALNALGGLDILVNNAGVGAMGPFIDAGPERLRRIFEVNFFGCTELTRLASPHLRRGRNPMVVNISSILGHRAIPGCVEYCASKFALQGWSEGLRAELAHLGIHVLVVSPGSTETEFHDHLLEDRSALRFRSRPMSADRCALLTVRAMRARRNEIVLTTGGKLLVWLNRLSPELVDWFMVRFARQRS
jgi:short-subunit dehydrogenase